MLASAKGSTSASPTTLHSTLQWFQALADKHTSGLGAIVCEKFAKEGANVAINYMSSEAAAQDIAKRLQAEFGVKAFALKGVSLSGPSNIMEYRDRGV